MTKYAAVVQYDGTNYHGWQLQTGVPTIQGSMEHALEKICRTLIRVHGAGRTDSGVHSLGQVAHFSVDWKNKTHDLRRALNALLPPDVAIVALMEASQDFHSRYLAKSKTYVYRILNQPLRSPLQRLYSWHIPIGLDEKAIRQSLVYLKGEHDFAAFGSATDGTPSTVRKVLDASWEETGSKNLYRFTIIGTGFLRYMVRSIVGTLAEIGRGKRSSEAMKLILESRDRSMSGPTAPPHGLFLESVDYGDSLIWKLSDADELLCTEPCPRLLL
jgi:tRNA pseudouridine38-40 synthase